MGTRRRSPAAVRVSVPVSAPNGRQRVPRRSRLPASGRLPFPFPAPSPFLFPSLWEHVLGEEQRGSSAPEVAVAAVVPLRACAITRVDACARAHVRDDVRRMRPWAWERVHVCACVHACDMPVGARVSSRVSRCVWEPVPVWWPHTHTCPWLLPAPLAAGTLRPALGVPVMGTRHVCYSVGVMTTAPRTSQACGVSGEKAGQGLGRGVAVREELSVQCRMGGHLEGSRAPRKDWGQQQTGTGQRGAGLQEWTEAGEAWVGCSRGLGRRQELEGHRTSSAHIYWTSGAQP